MRSREIAIAIGVLLMRSFQSSAAEVDFHRDVKPILESRCYPCHGASQQMGGLRFDQRQSALRAAIVPGKSAESKVIDRITSATEGVRMPLTGPPLSADQIHILKLWIDTGANWPDDIRRPTDDRGKERIGRQMLCSPQSATKMRLAFENCWKTESYRMLGMSAERRR